MWTISPGIQASTRSPVHWHSIERGIRPGSFDKSVSISWILQRWLVERVSYRIVCKSSVIADWRMGVKMRPLQVEFTHFIGGEYRPSTNVYWLCVWNKKYDLHYRFTSNAFECHFLNQWTNSTNTNDSAYIILTKFQAWIPLIEMNLPTDWALMSLMLVNGSIFAMRTFSCVFTIPFTEVTYMRMRSWKLGYNLNSSTQAGYSVFRMVCKDHFQIF